jgi:dTDP-4-amino-4,6-dideoxygalactose transaminase
MIVNFYERYQPKEQLRFIEDALMNGSLSTDGKYIGLLKEHFRQSDGIGEILFTPSAAAALDLAVRLLGLKPGDEVIIPSFTFPSAAGAVIKCGGMPVLCDIDPKTKCISLEDAASRITGKTKAVIPTHYAGISCDMDSLMNLARTHGIAVVEDAAQAVHSGYTGKLHSNHNDKLLSRYDGNPGSAPLGTIGDLGAYSFHHTKNFSCGEGGAFLCKDPSLIKKAEILRDNGTNKAQYLRGEISGYSWQCAGSNYLMSEACAALLYSQLLEYDVILARRKAVFDAYQSLLDEAAVHLDGKVSLMEIPGYSAPNYHICYLDCRDHNTREALRTGLLADGIDVRVHYVPLHLSDFGKALGYSAADFPGSVSVYETLLRLPIHTEMTAADCETVADFLIRRVKKI